MQRYTFTLVFSFSYVTFRFQIIPKSSQEIFKNLFKDYYDSMAKHLLKDHKSLQNRERQNRQTVGVSLL